MIWAVIVGYSLLLVGKSTYQNIKINKDIEIEKQQIKQLEQKKSNLELALVYYQTKSFKETEARQRLNLQSADEHVVALPQASSEPSFIIVTTDDHTTNKADTTTTPPYLAWWRLFFAKL